MDPIFQRVSVRDYLDKPVEQEKIELLLRAAMAAPSSTNQQDWEFIVVTDKELLEGLSKVSAGGPGPKPGGPGGPGGSGGPGGEGEPPPMPPGGSPPKPGGPSSVCADAPLAIVVLGNKDRMRCPENWEQDLGAATENILLEAVQLGLGGVWLGIATLENRMENVRKLFNLPENILPYCVLALGYPASEPKAQQDRYKPEYVHYNGF